MSRAEEDELARLRLVIRLGGAAYRAERAALGIPGGQDEVGQPLVCSTAPCGAGVCASGPSPFTLREHAQIEDLKQACAKMLATQVRIFFALELKEERVWNEDAVLATIARLRTIAGLSRRLVGTSHDGRYDQETAEALAKALGFTGAH